MSDVRLELETVAAMAREKGAMSQLKTLLNHSERDRMKRLCFVCSVFSVFFVFLASLASAQTITSYQLKIYLVGAATPISAPTTLPVASFVCNQAPPAPTAPTANPTRIVIDDVAFPLPPSPAARVCIYTDAGTGPLLSLPFGTANYEGTLTATNAAGSSSESVRSSFTRPGLQPGAPPTGVRFIK